MKSLLRMVIFFVSLLFLPDPLFATMFEEPSKAPISVQLQKLDVAGENQAGVSDTAVRKQSFQVHPFQGRPFFVAQVNKEAVTQKKLDAQRSKEGLRIKKKKDFFKSKSPLPTIQMPTDWDGQVSSPPAKVKKTKKSKKARSKTQNKKLTKGRSSPPIPSKKPDLRRVKRTKSGAIYESQTYRKTPVTLDRSKTGDRSKNAKDIRALGNPKSVGRSGYSPKANLLSKHVKLPLPRLKPKGFDSKKQAQHLKLQKKEKTALKRENSKNKEDETTSGKVQKTAFVVPPPVTFWKPKEIKDAQLVCQVLMKGIDATVTPIKPIRRGVCGTPAPLKLKEVGAHKGTNKIKINPAATLNCQYTARFAKWANEKLQPLALKHLNSPVSMVHNVASYSCRHRYNDKKRKISEHALANALDIAGFTLKNGTTVSVLKHWEEEGDLGAFLKAVHASACDSFVVVLGPEANEAHKNHFHFDVGRYKVCE